MIELTGQEKECRSISRTAGRLIADQRSLWRTCTVVFGAFAVLKGFHRPYSWALTQAQIDYSHGFVKRGLQGATLDLFGIHHYKPLYAIFFFEFAVFLCLVTTYVRSTRPEKVFGNLALCAILASSYATTYLTTIVGYPDLILASLATVLVFIRSPDRRFTAALLLIPAAILVHENFLLVFMPVVLLTFILDARLGPHTRSAAYAILLLLLGLTLAVDTSLHSRLSLVQARQFEAEIAARADFWVQPDVSETLTRSLRENVRITYIIMHRSEWMQQMVASLLAVLPATLLALRLSYRLILHLSAHRTPRERQCLTAAVFMSSLAPLALYVLGWDCARWNALTTVSTALVVFLLARHTSDITHLLSKREMNAATFILAFNMSAGHGFFGAFQGRLFPFFF